MTLPNKDYLYQRGRELQEQQYTAWLSGVLAEAEDYPAKPTEV